VALRESAAFQQLRHSLITSVGITALETTFEHDQPAMSAFSSARGANVNRHREGQ